MDIACGIGYGSYVISNINKNVKITSVGISSKAIEYARKFYKSENIRYINDNALKFKSDSKFDTIISFETIEHVREDEKLLKNFHSLLAENGQFICSTPNQNLLPFSKETHPYHVKHYKTEEMVELLESCGFKVKDVFFQKKGDSEEIEKGVEGKFNIFICCKN